MNAVHNEKPKKDTYKAAIMRMLKYIHDEERLYRIYKYILYVYTKNS